MTLKRTYYSITDRATHRHQVLTILTKVHALSLKFVFTAACGTQMSLVAVILALLHRLFGGGTSVAGKGSLKIKILNYCRVVL